MCRVRLNRNSVRAPVVIDHLLAVVERKCGNLGCDETFVAKDLLDHESKVCQFRPVPCPLAFCKAHIPLRGMFGHMESKHK